MLLYLYDLCRLTLSKMKNEGKGSLFYEIDCILPIDSLFVYALF